MSGSVRRDDRVDPEILEPGDEVEHFFATIRIESGGRLIEQHSSGIVDDRLGEFRSLFHAGENSPMYRNRSSWRPTRPRTSLARWRAARRQPAEFGGIPGSRRRFGREADSRPRASSRHGRGPRWRLRSRCARAPAPCRTLRAARRAGSSAGSSCQHRWLQRVRLVTVELRDRHRRWQRCRRRRTAIR